MAELRHRLNAETSDPAQNVTLEKRRAKTQIIFDLLIETYGLPRWQQYYDPLSELIMTILSQHTSDKNSGRAFQNLLDAFQHDWLAVLNAPTDKIAEAIKIGGLANIKSKRIQDVLAEIYDTYGQLNLDFLDSLPLNEARSILNKLKGVGPKTTACVLMFALNKPVLPVDTHVHRVSLRLGLIPLKTTAEQAHLLLEAQLEPAQIYPFHVNMITHGRRICKALRPRCPDCPLQEHCDYYYQVYLPEQNKAKVAD